MDSDTKFFFETLGSEIKEVKQLLSEVKISIKELYEERNRQDKTLIELKGQMTNLEKDVNNLGNTIRDHTKSSDCFRDDVKEIKMFQKEIQNKKTVEYVEKLKTEFSLLKAMFYGLVAVVGLIATIFGLLFKLGVFK